MAQSNFRFSIRAILLATGYTAIAVAALVHPNKLWLGTVYGITVALLFYSLLGVIYGTDRARAYWTGCALFGFGYLALIFGPLSEVSSKLPTTLLLDYSCEKFHGQVYPMLPSATYSPGLPVTFGPPATYTPGPVSPSNPSPNTSGIPDTTFYIPAPTTTTPEPNAEPEDVPTEKSDAEPGIESDDLAEVESTTVSNPLATSSGPFYPPLYTTPSYSPPVVTYSFDEYRYFTSTGHAVFALLFASIGGLIAQCMFASRARSVPSASA